VARLLIRVGKELERKLLFGLEGIVRLKGVARDAVDIEPGAPEVLVQVAKIATLRRTTGRAVLGVEVEDQPLAALVGEPERTVAGAGETEVRDGLAERFQRF
jgi:hypothetical protein